MTLPLEKQVCSFGLAVRLSRLGVTQSSLFTWRHDYRHDEWFVSHWVGPVENEHYAAFTSTELGHMLPEGTDTTPGFVTADVMEGRGDKYWACDRWLGADKGGRHVETADTEADARAKILIYLLEQKLITL